MLPRLRRLLPSRRPGAPCPHCDEPVAIADLPSIPPIRRTDHDAHLEHFYSMTLSFEEILRLSVPERVQLVEAIWESIAASPESLPVTDAQRQELDRRLDAYARDPSELRSWDEVRVRLEHRE